MRRRRLSGLVAFNVTALLAVAGLMALGTWQVHRRAWKLDLLARVETRVHAEPVAAPGPAEWPRITGTDDAYRRVRVTGAFLQDDTTLVQAVTEFGAGFWVLSPLRAEAGFTVLVNRGFVPADRRDPGSWRKADGTVTVAGLLRLSEPGGAFLRANDPAADRWTSRDVDAIAKARGLEDVAPYFIDAAAEPVGGLPVGGLTVVAFHNNHLIYAITWFVLAAMASGAVIYVDLDVVRRKGDESDAN